MVHQDLVSSILPHLFSPSCLLLERADLLELFHCYLSTNFLGLSQWCWTNTARACVNMLMWRRVMRRILTNSLLPCWRFNPELEQIKKTVHRHHLKPSPLPSLSVAAGWWKITGLERPIECHYDNEDHIRATDLPVFVLPGVIIAFLAFPGPACCPR